MRAAGCILLSILVASVVSPAARSVSPGSSPPALSAGERGRDRCSSRLHDRLESSRPGDTIPVWIFLADRGPSMKNVRGDGACLSPRAASRRFVRGKAAPEDSDLPVYQPYVEVLRNRAVRIRHVSRYFNAVSAEIEAGEAPAVGAFRFVQSIDLISPSPPLPEPSPVPGRGSSSAPRGSSGASPYGDSYDQLNQVGAIELLDDGYNGSGTVGGRPPVLVAILDTGFKRDHTAFADLAVEAEWDFVQGDGITSNQPGDTIDQDVHGTEVLGVIAAHHEGSLVGPAWGARYLLAKTEIKSREIRIEEDHWVAGIEWADSAGADVVTSSLGYIDWYTRAQLDGNTALCTRAADIAVSHGVVVVNSAGNQGTAGLVAPADGDSVLAIGAVDRDGFVAYFSSRGPTADGRIKPDLMAMGVGAASVSYGDLSGNAAYNGTSFAAPIVAGVCALLLEVHPDWGPMDIRAALRATASASGEPDNVHGWGIPDAALAAEFPESTMKPAAFPNPFSTETRFQFFLAAPAVLTVRVYDCAGTLVKTLASGRTFESSVTFTWDGTNERGEAVASGVYFIFARGGPEDRTAKVVLVR